MTKYSNLRCAPLWIWTSLLLCYDFHNIHEFWQV